LEKLPVGSIRYSYVGKWDGIIGVDIETVDAKDLESTQFTYQWFHFRPALTGLVRYHEYPLVAGAW